MPGAGIAVVAVMAGAALAWSVQGRRALLRDIPVPKDLDRLEGPLRDYVREQVAWVRQAPRAADRHAGLALVYAANGLWAEAGVAFGTAARLNPNEPLAQLYTAVAAGELGRQTQAVAMLRHLTTRFPSFAPGFYRLGDLLLRAGEWDEAGRCFDRLIQLAPGEWRGYAGKGDALLRRGRPAEAVPWLEKALVLDPSAKIAHHLLGQAYQRAGRLREAQRELRLGADARQYPMPDDWSAVAPRHMRLLRDLLEMADDYTQAGRPQQAVAILAPLTRYHTNHVQLLVRLAAACNGAGRPQPVERLLERALTLDPANLPAHLAMSRACLTLGRTNEALLWADRAAARAPDSPQPHLARADVFLALEQDAEAVRELELAAQRDPNSARILVDLGDIQLRNRNRPDEALACYRRAVEVDPVFAPAYARLADCYLAQKRLEEARDALDNLRAVAPRDPALPGLLERWRQGG